MWSLVFATCTVYYLPNLDPPLNNGSSTMDSDCTSSTENCEQLGSLNVISVISDLNK